MFVRRGHSCVCRDMCFLQEVLVTVYVCKHELPGVSGVWFVCMCVSLGAYVHVRVILVCLCLFQGPCMCALVLCGKVCLMSAIWYLWVWISINVCKCACVHE